MKQVRKQQNQNLSLLHWIGLAFLSLLIIFLPYRAGLYNAMNIDYEMPLLQAMMFTFVLLLISAVFLAQRWSLNSLKAVLSVWALLIPLFYYISTFYAATTHGAQIVFLLSAMCAAFFIFALYYGEGLTAQKVLLGALGTTVYAVILYGVLAMLGVTYSQDALWFQQGQYRLTSVFQYPNTYAGFLLAALMICLYWVVTSKKWYAHVLHSLMLIPICLSIVLTFSRGALVIVPLLALLYLCLLRFREQIVSILFMLTTSVLTLAILGKVTTYYHQIADIVQPKENKPVDTVSLFHSTTLKLWLMMLGASVVNAALVYAIHRWLVPWLDKRFPGVSRRSSWWIPGAVVVLGVIAALLVMTKNPVIRLLPADIANRIESIGFRQHSVLERNTFYRDAWKIVQDHPFGIGGSGWSVLYEKYQNNPYMSTQVHSYPLQTLVEIGWIGFLVYLGFFAFAFFLYIRHYLRTRTDQPTGHFVFFLFSVGLLVHSVIDFDMSFGYIGILLFFCMGAMLAPFARELAVAKWESYKDRKWGYAYPAVIGVLAILLLVWSIREYNADSNYKKAINMATVEQQGLEAIMVPLEKAIDYSPANAMFVHRKIDWLTQAYDQTQDKTYLEQIEQLFAPIKKLEPYNRTILQDEFQYYKNAGNSEKVLELLEGMLAKYPWDQSLYESAITEYVAAGNQQRAKELYDEVLRRVEHLKTLPPEQNQGNPFEVTPAMKQALGIDS